MKNIFLLLLFIPLITNAQVIITIAGNGGTGYSGDGGPATNAEIYDPYNIGVDDSGNVYIDDVSNSRIRKVTKNGIITTICGTGTMGYLGDGFPATGAWISGWHDFAFDHHGNIYLSESGNHCVRKINAAGIISRVAGNGDPGFSGDGGPASNAQLKYPTGIVFDDTGNLYINDYENYRIRKVNTSGIITTIAGIGISGFSPDGSSVDTIKLSGAGNIRIDSQGNLLFLDNRRIRCISKLGIVSTVAGTGVTGYSGDGGPATDAMIIASHIAIDKSDNIYLADNTNHTIRKITAGIISTIAGMSVGGNTGDGGDPTLAKLSCPVGIAVDTANNIYIGDLCNENVKEITLDTPLLVRNIHEEGGMIIISPNPSKGSFDILINAAFHGDCEASISNIEGVTQKKVIISTNKRTTINVDLPAGVYIIKIIAAKEYYSRKLIIE